MKRGAANAMRGRGRAVAAGTVEQVGQDPHGEPKPYVYRGKGRVDGATTYMLDGTAHRFDGQCHADCEDVR